MPAYNGSVAADWGGLIYLVYAGDNEDHWMFSLYLEVDSECRWHCGLGPVSADIEVISGSILCMIGEVVEQTFEIETEGVFDTSPADFTRRVSDDGRRRRPLVVRVRVHYLSPPAAASNIASASTSPTGTKAAVS